MLQALHTGCCLPLWQPAGFSVQQDIVIVSYNLSFGPQIQFAVSPQSNSSFQERQEILTYNQLQEDNCHFRWQRQKRDCSRFKASLVYKSSFKPAKATE